MGTTVFISNPVTLSGLRSHTQVAVATGDHPQVPCLPRALKSPMLPTPKSFAHNLIFPRLFWLHLEAHGILAPQLGIKPTPPAVEAQILNYWTTREVPQSVFLSSVFIVESRLVCKAPFKPFSSSKAYLTDVSHRNPPPWSLPMGALNSQKFMWHLKI